MSADAKDSLLHRLKELAFQQKALQRPKEEVSRLNRSPSMPKDLLTPPLETILSSLQQDSLALAHCHACTQLLSANYSACIAPCLTLSRKTVEVLSSPMHGGRPPAAPSSHPRSPLQELNLPSWPPTLVWLTPLFSNAKVLHEDIECFEHPFSRERKPAHAVLLDRSRGYIMVVIRGSENWKDYFTDTAGNSVAWQVSRWQVNE